MKPSVVDVQLAVAQHFGLSMTALLSGGRSHRVAIPRQLAYWLAAKCTGHGLSDIGRKFGRDHATVWHGVKATEWRLSVDADLSAEAAELLERLVPIVPPAGWHARPVVTFGATQ